MPSLIQCRTVILVPWVYMRCVNDVFGSVFISEVGASVRAKAGAEVTML